MLEDLKAEEKNLGKMDEAGEELTRIEDKPDNLTIVRQRKDNITRTYDSLVRILEEKIEKTEKVVQNGKKFFQMENDVAEKTKALKKKTVKQETVAVDPKKVKEQLLEVEEWLVEAQTVNTMCSEAELYANDIILFNKQDEDVEEKIKEQIRAIKLPVLEIIGDLEDREKKLKDRLQECGAFQDQFDDFERRLKNIDERIEQQKQKPLSSNPARITMTIGEIDSIGKDFMEELQLYRIVQKSGKQVLDTLDTESEWKQLKGHLDETTKLWDAIDKKIDTEKDHVTKVKELSVEFFNKKNDVLKWLDENEKRFMTLEPESCEWEKLSKQQKEINSVQSDIDHHKTYLERLETLIDELEDACGEDVEELHEISGDIKEKWKRAESLLLNRKETIAAMQDKMRRFGDLKRPVEDTLKKIKAKLGNLSFTGADEGRIRQVSEDISKIQKQADDLEPRLDLLDNMASEIQEEHISSDCKPLRDEVAELKEGFDELFNAVSSKAESISGVIADLDSLTDTATSTETKIHSMVEMFEKNKPLKLDLQELEASAVFLRDVESELKTVKPIVDELTYQGRQLTEKGFGFEEFNTKLTSLESQYQELSKRTPKKLSDVAELINRLNEFYNEHEEAEKGIAAVERTLEEQSAVGSVVDEIDAQMEELKDVQTGMEKLQEKVGNLTDLQSFIKSTSPNIEASPVEDVLSELNNRLLNANQQISDRKGKLEEAFVKCGKFKDALQSLLEWLEETQELVDGQRQINALDPNVLKAQIMEQKLLIRIFKDRAASVISLQNTGKDLLEAKDSEDEKNQEIESDLGKATKLWDSLNSYVNFRMERMGSVLETSTEFTKEYENSIEQMDELQNLVESDEWKPSGRPNEIAEQMTRFEDVRKKLKDLEPLIDDTAKRASELNELCAVEERETVRQKMQALFDRFGSMSEKRAIVSKTMKETLDLSSGYHRLHEEINEWFGSFETKLKELSDADENSVRELQKEMAAKKKDVDDVAAVAAKLQKVVNEENAKEIKGIVDKDKETYDNLKAIVEQKARDMFLAKEKVDKFDKDVESLASWLVELSERYQKIEPIAVDSEKVKEQINDHQMFLKEVATNEPRLKEVFDTGEMLLMACNEDEEPAIKEKIDNLKYRHEEVIGKTGERQAQLVEALLLSQQFADMYKETQSRLKRTEEYLKDIGESRSKGIEVQKEKHKGLEDGISHLRPLIVSLKATGEDLMKLSGPGHGSVSIREKLDDSEKRWNALHKDVEDKGIEIGETAQKTEEVQVTLDELLSQFQAYKEKCKTLPSIAVKEEQIKEQINDHEQCQFEISEYFEPVERIETAVEEIRKQDPESQIAKSMAGKKKKLQNTVAFVKEATDARRKALEDGLTACRKFWPGLEQLKKTLMDVQHKIESQDEPHFQPQAIEKLQKEHDALRDELDSNEEVINTLCQVSPILVAKASQADKLDVHKQLSEVTDLWDSLESTWSKRKTELENIRHLAEQYEESVQELDLWLTKSERELDAKSPIGAEVGVVKQQLTENRGSYKDLVGRQIDITQLNQKASALMDKIDHEDSDSIQEQVDEIKSRWEKLQSAINERQSLLEETLYRLGQFSVVMEEIITWMKQTITVLSKKKPPLLKDKKIIEVELEKLKVRKQIIVTVLQIKLFF